MQEIIIEDLDYWEISIPDFDFRILTFRIWFLGFWLLGKRIRDIGQLPILEVIKFRICFLNLFGRGHFQISIPDFESGISLWVGILYF